MELNFKVLNNYLDKITSNIFKKSIYNIEEIEIKKCYL
jgi:hypothetical protein